MSNNEITLNGLTFVPYLTHDELHARVQAVANEIKRDLTTDDPLFVCVLNGAFIFAADLFRACNIPNAQIEFVRMKSYEGTHSTGHLSELLWLTDDVQVAGRDVIIVEDIVDSGLTGERLLRRFAEMGAASVKMATMLFKPQSLVYGKAPDYVCCEIPNEFVLGSGLDFNEIGRGLPNVYILKKEQ